MPMELLCTSSWACDRLLSDDERSCEVHVQKSPFTTVSGVRQGRSDKRVFLPQCPPNPSKQRPLKTRSYHFAVVSVAIIEKENQEGNNKTRVVMLCRMYNFADASTCTHIFKKKNQTQKPFKPEQKFLDKSLKRVLVSWTKGRRQLLVEKKRKRVVKNFVGT